MKLISSLTLTLIVSLVSLLAPAHASAQEESYRFDIGAGIGMSGYLGDLNNSNPFKSPGLAADLSFRYRFDTRWAIVTNLGYAGLSANSGQIGSALPGDIEYKFKSNVIDLTERAEVNFFAFGQGESYKKLRRWTPYMSVGVGLLMASCDGSTNLAFTIPMSLGVKYKLRERVNLGLEFTMTKAFSDHVDGDIADLYQVKSSFLKNTDWYSQLALTISYEFGLRCPTCHYYD